MKERRARLFADDFILLEGPRWRDERIWVADVFDCKVYSLGLDGSREIVANQVPPRPSSIGFLPDGTLLVVSSIDRKLLKLVDGKLRLHADLSSFATGDVNDFVVDLVGRIYIGNFGYDLFAGAPHELADLHMIEPNGEIRVAAAGLDFPNGAIIMNEGRTLVVAETWAGKLIAFDRAVDGRLSNRRVFASLEGRQPDGICVDAASGIWTPSYGTGEVLRVLEGGEITDRVAFEGKCIACQLGGRNGSTLFCTVYAGSMEESVVGKRLGQLQVVDVEIPALGFRG